MIYTEQNQGDKPLLFQGPHGCLYCATITHNAVFLSVFLQPLIATLVSSLLIQILAAYNIY